MKLIYIAGPYRASTRWNEERNVRDAEKVAHAVVAIGGMPVCPHSNTRHYFSDLQSPEWWLAATLELMRRCDAVYLMRGWTSSEGAKGEDAEARRLGIPVFTKLSCLAYWLRDGEEEGT